MSESNRQRMLGALYHLWTNFDGRALFKCSTVRFINGKKGPPVFFIFKVEKHVMLVTLFGLI